VRHATARPLVVAIDGPAGAGKSTISAGLAARLSLPHVDTGAYYRAATLAVLRAGADPRDARACAAVVRRAAIGRAGDRTLLDGDDVERAIRGPEITAAVSQVSAHAEVRALLVALQRAEVGHGGGVVEGRDAGTVVVPHADLKVWLTASVSERALRRAGQVGAVDDAAVAEHERAIVRRDAHDRQQMTPAPDAVLVDTTGRPVGEIVEELAGLALEVCARQAGQAPQ
jgi:cytidylate kinase